MDTTQKPAAPANAAIAALVDLVGVLTHADKDGAIQQALANEGITDAFGQALEEALKAIFLADSIPYLEVRYEVKVSDNLKTVTDTRPVANLDAKVVAAIHDLSPEEQCRVLDKAYFHISR